MRRRDLIIAAAAAIGLCAAGPGLAHEAGHAGHGGRDERQPDRSARVHLADVPVIDAAGAERRFAGNVVADRIAVIDAIFTNCTTVCPVTSALLAELRGQLDAAGIEVDYVSVSLDPVRDTPERLTSYAATYGAHPSWTLVTGERQDITAVLRGLGSYSADPAAHLPSVLVGDPVRQDWRRFYGLPDPERLAAAIKELAQLRAPKREVSHVH